MSPLTAGIWPNTLPPHCKGPSLLPGPLPEPGVRGWFPCAACDKPTAPHDDDGGGGVGGSGKTLAWHVSPRTTTWLHCEEEEEEEKKKMLPPSLLPSAAGQNFVSSIFARAVVRSAGAGRPLAHPRTLPPLKTSMHRSREGDLGLLHCRPFNKGSAGVVHFPAPA